MAHDGLTTNGTARTGHGAKECKGPRPLAGAFWLAPSGWRLLAGAMGVRRKGTRDEQNANGHRAKRHASIQLKEQSRRTTTAAARPGER